ncbi:unnamed protein product [Adineta ricciae]|uniref:G-protein coupled receptors family 1 profile domain-containing protein n=1 Tax=Adineta ricciae TaxID=249248 RepID=A0A814S5V4_ADIRI|nr:unnamed protein product [Adineta ricciae]CAF1651525.1 unnamed protein product [Adineta ricciae]
MDIYQTLEIVRNTVYATVLFIALVYSCLILFIPRFRHRTNMFILNFCINTIFTAAYFIFYFYGIYYDMPQSMCVLFQYAFNVASVQVPFAFVAFSVHRFCVIVYHIKPFFKTKNWVAICIATQWIAQLLISLPFVFESYEDCTSNTVWMGCYTLITAVILPSLINTILNIGILICVRRSTRRTHSQESTGTGNRITHRDISLIKQMVFTFTMFIVGWTPAYVINTINVVIYVDFSILMMSVYLGAVCLLALIINLFVYNREIRNCVFQRCLCCVNQS